MTENPLRLYDTLTRTVRPFAPITPGQVRMYSCGPTVYSRAHLGNMRAYVFADTVRRALLWKGYDVRHVINITDVGHLLADADLGDDKVELAARREQRSVWDLTEHYTKLFENDAARLGLLAPERWTKATDYIDQMLAFARRLEATGHAYALPEGLYFDTSTIDGYGAMATMAHDDNAEARIASIGDKRHPADFALWRTFPPDEPTHAMEWDSPWGRGAPGWHLECSVMSIDALGDHFDIHTGGVDHREVHHPNEDAQSRAYLDDARPWVNWWMHVEFVQFEGAKMAKSKGNVMTLDDVTALGSEPLAYKLLLLASHYRSQVTVGPASITASGNRYRRLVDTVRRRLGTVDPPDPSRPLLTVGAALDAVPAGSAEHDAVLRLDAAISDDLATPKVLALLDETLRGNAGAGAGSGSGGAAVVLDAFRSLTGIDLLAAAAAPADAGDDLDPASRAAIDELVGRREQARQARDFALADQVRDELLSRHGIVVTDTPDGPTWRQAAPTSSG
jgi:cysteinyl-tRNA synthetase